MAAGASPAPSRARARLRVWALAALVVLGSPAAAVFTVQKLAAARIERFEARWRAEAAAYAEARPRPGPPLPWITGRSGNAGRRYDLLLQEHRSLLGRAPPGSLSTYEQPYDARRGALAPTLTALDGPLDAFLDRAQPALDAVEEALALDEIGWPEDAIERAALQIDAAGLADRVMGGYLLRRLILADARRHAARGNARLAVRRAADGCAAADDLADFDSRMCPQLADVVAHEHDDIEAARMALEAARRLEAGPSLARALRYNRLRWGADVLEAMGRLGSPAGPPRLGRVDRLRLAFGWPVFDARVREVEALAADRPWVQVLPALPGIYGNANSGLGALVGDWALPGASHGPWLEVTVRRRLALLACAVRLSRIENGTLPGSASDLMPRYLAAEPLDPSTERPFAWKVDPATGALTIEAVPENPALPIPLSLTVAPPRRR